MINDLQNVTSVAAALKVLVLLRINQELQAKGISKGVATLSLRQFQFSSENIQKVRIKKFGPELPKNLSDFEQSKLVICNIRDFRWRRLIKS